jgi:hypothetical protein
MPEKPLTQTELPASVAAAPGSGHKIAVLAGNRQQFELWAKENPVKAGRRKGGNYEHAFYAGSAMDICGRYVSEVIRVGTWYRRRDLDDLTHEIKCAQLAYTCSQEIQQQCG